MALDPKEEQKVKDLLSGVARTVVSKEPKNIRVPPA